MIHLYCTHAVTGRSANYKNNWIFAFCYVFVCLFCVDFLLLFFDLQFLKLARKS